MDVSFGKPTRSHSEIVVRKLVYWFQLVYLNIMSFNFSGKSTKIQLTKIFIQQNLSNLSILTPDTTADIHVRHIFTSNYDSRTAIKVQTIKVKAR